MGDTPDAILEVRCPVCGARAGLQCSIAIGIGSRFDTRRWCHEERAAAAEIVLNWGP